jgi:hypothetical protein
MLKKVGRLFYLVVRIPGYRSRGPGSIFGDTVFLWDEVGRELGPLNLVSRNEERTNATGLLLIIILPLQGGEEERL